MQNDNKSEVLRAEIGGVGKWLKYMWLLYTSKCTAMELEMDASEIGNALASIFNFTGMERKVVVHVVAFL